MHLRHRPAALRSARGFTVVELLVVVGIIVVLLSIVVVAVNTATRTSQATNTQALMSTISTGLTQFRSDIGYLPPVLATPTNTAFYKASRDYAPPLDEARIGKAAYRQEIQKWYSITSIPDYLLGYGDASQDGAGRVPEGKTHFELNQNDAPLGIRNPGPDGYWGVASTVPGCVTGSKAGTFQTRTAFLGGSNCAAQSAALRQGRVYGPYFELRNDRLLGAVERNATPDPNTGEYRVYFPGDALPVGTTWDDMPKVIVDYWGQPIRYYRKPYMPGLPGQDIRRPATGRMPSLSDVFVLRPFHLRGRDAIDNDFADDYGDTTTTSTLNGGAFALFSAGPDRRVRFDVRADSNLAAGDQEYNRDNLVEVGR